ncbi:MAG: hypothetical protein OXI95_19970 [bacterium]|nr:hypothetical protein [bacterium]
MSDRSRLGDHSRQYVAALPLNQDYIVTITDPGRCRLFAVFRGRLTPGVGSTVTGVPAARHAT